MSENMNKINEENLESVSGGCEDCGNSGNWIYATVHGVVHYDSSSCLTLRDCPNGNVMYTDAGRPMGWQNGDCALIQPSSRQGNWVRANWNGCIGWTNANYLYY